jgi:hypothetical protein
MFSSLVVRSSAGTETDGLFEKQNDPFKFTNQLCTSVHLKHKTQVAVARIHFPLSFRTLATQSGINNLFVLSDIVDDNLVGDSRMNLLCIISIDKKKTSTSSQFVQFNNLVFHPIVKNPIHSIRIRIQDEKGVQIMHSDEKKFENDETFIVLAFK